MTNKLLMVAFLAVLATNAEAVTAKQAVDVDARVDNANQAAPAHRTGLNSPDPYADNARAYKSNQYGAAAIPPKSNNFLAVEPAANGVDNYNYDANSTAYTGSNR